MLEMIAAKTMIDYLKFLSERYDRITDAGKQKRFIRNLITADALHNLDIITILRQQGLKNKPDEKKKLLLCLRSNADELIESLGMSPSEILEGELPKEIDELNRSSPEKRVMLNSRDDFERQSELWLHNFATRKIRLLKELARCDFDSQSRLNLERRSKNISLSLRVLADRLRVPTAV